MTEQKDLTIRELADKTSSLTNDWYAYWKAHSGFGSWQFWVIVIMLIIPLIALVLRLDRSKAFRLGFYGFAIHVIAIYSELYATSHRMWDYPYKLIPLPAVSFSLDASLIPVAYMLMYQWTLNHRKNYYLALLLLAIGFAFIFKPLMDWLGLFWMNESNYIVLFGFYYVGGMIGKWVTDLFEWGEAKARQHS